MTLYGVHHQRECLLLDLETQRSFLVTTFPSTVIPMPLVLLIIGDTLILIGFYINVIRYLFYSALLSLFYYSGGNTLIIEDPSKVER